MKRIFCCLLCTSLFCSFMPHAKARTDVTMDEFNGIISSYSVNNDIPAYREYLEQHPQIRPDESIVVDATAYSRYEEGGLTVEPKHYENYEGAVGTSVLTSETGLIEYNISVEDAGFYQIKLEYYPVPGKSSAIQRSIFLDGKLPYRELALLEFSRIWQNRQASGGVIPLVWEKDNQGNDLKPTMTESPQWLVSYAYDSGGYVTECLSLYLTQGAHTLTLHSQREPMLLRRIVLCNDYNAKDYVSVKAEWDAAGALPTTSQMVTIEAEDAIRTSSQMLYPIQDQSSPAIAPSSPVYLLNNTIGGNSWRLVGQWIEWEFVVPESGYYELTLRDRQSFKRGTYVSRRISIDGVVPFSEIEDYGFGYSQSWRTDRICDNEGKPYQFYLEAGTTHTLRMEAVLGDFGEIVSAVKDAVYELNSIYRSVIARTGVKPDKYADYQIERTLPELTSQLTTVRDQLSWVIDELQRVAGHSSERERVLVTMRDQLNSLIQDNERFPRMVESFKVNVRACGTWLSEAVNQPLQFDALYFHSSDVQIRVDNNTVFHQIAYEIMRLWYSFSIDYNQVGNISESEIAITLWIGSGRDQANVIKSLIDERFTQEYGINVNVMLVDMSTLLQATLAGQGPDAAIQVSGELPMNFGLRGSVADLRGFDGFDDVRARFAESAMVPYEYGGACYALPETQIFPMMFYRKDILADLGIGLPETWDDVAVIMSELSFNHMEFGMLPSEQVFSMLLYQNGGQYYNENATRSALDSEEAINAFKLYTEFYTDYKLDRATSVEDRFRTGETPIIIADYTLYNVLQVSAPDLKGIWGFAPVPGTRREDGSIDRSVSSNGGGTAAATTMIGVTGGNGGACVMMESSEKKEQVWEFMKWWTSAEIQLLFGHEMESLMGSAARVPTANLEAFSMMPWPLEDYNALKEQSQYVKGIPQVPGGYFTYRNVNNAFYSVTTPLYDRPAGQKQMAMPREELMDKVILINDEIRYKRKEFGLPMD